MVKKSRNTLGFTILCAVLLTIVLFTSWELFELEVNHVSVFTLVESRTSLDDKHDEFYQQYCLQNSGLIHQLYEEGLELLAIFIVSFMSLLALNFKRRNKELEKHIDIAEENLQVKKQIHQAQRLESIGTLAGGIAHDFNNILMAIQGSIGLMIMDMELHDPLYKELQGIEDHVKSAAQLTNRLLGFARGGKYDVKPRNLNNILRDASELFGRTSKGSEVFLKFQEGIWPVELDKSQLDQVFMNMFINAGQASRDNICRIHIETENVEYDSIRYVEITISDSGKGIHPKHIEQIFDPFFTTKKVNLGTGMGLAQVYGTIKNHGGKITVESQVGSGTTFKIVFPVSDKDMYYEDEVIVEGKLKIGDGLVLIIDDETMVSNMAQRMLEKIGYKTLVKNSGFQGVEAYKANHSDIICVLLDMVMPGMSGKKVFEALHKFDPNVKILLSSGYSLDGEARSIMDQGCQGFIQKPYSIKKLADTIRDII